MTSRSDADVFVSKEFSGSGVFQDGGHSVSLSADALFQLDTTTHVLTVFLANTSPSAGFQIGGAEVLTELFFNATSTLTPTSVSIPSGSTILGTVSAGDTLGGNWEYVPTSGAPSNIPNHVISSSGVYASGNPNSSPPAFGTPSGAIGSPSWGLVNTSDGIANGIFPLVDHQLQFAFQASPNFNLDELGDSVLFQFGTSSSEPQLLGPDPPPALPEPTSLAIWSLLGIAGMAWRRRAG